MILEGKKLVITGVITKDSIAFHAAERALHEGASVVLTSFGRARRMTERAAKRLSAEVDVLELDVNNPRIWTALTESLRERWGAWTGRCTRSRSRPRTRWGGGS